MTYFPSHVQIETVNRYCDARCPMCTIKFVPDFEKNAPDDLSYHGRARKAEIMSLETFQVITQKFKEHVDKIDFLSLHGCGEPLMDKTLPEKVEYAKNTIGFKSVGFTSNCSLLKEPLAQKLLDAGLSCIIPSIDGLTAEVHEAIRPRTRFEDINKNVRRFIELRDAGNYNCKVLVRMIKQQLNITQWEKYQQHWLSLLNPEKNDAVLGFEIHNNGGKVKNFDTMKLDNFLKNQRGFNEELSKSATGACSDLFSRLSIFASGDIALCSADQAEFFKLGNIVKEDPIAVFNNPIFTRYREKWINNQFMELEHCKNCSIAISRANKTIT
jgi:radical SAM protein with 4Fe4S-binding SPASM domain